GPEPRPGWESMRSIKRGMSAGDVRRLMGDPQNVVPGGNGWSTWLYDDGRMISFDGRGRAQSPAGVPAPSPRPVSAFPIARSGAARPAWAAPRPPDPGGYGG